MTVDPLDASKLSERELLLILHERVGMVSRELHELKDGYAQRLSTVESRLEHLQEFKAEKAAVDGSFKDVTLINDQRTRQLNRLTNYIWAVGGALAILQIVVPILLKYGVPHN